MLKCAVKFRTCVTFALLLILLSPVAFACGDDDHGERGRNFKEEEHHERSRRVSRSHSWGGRHHYRDGRWYNRSWFGWEFPVGALFIGARVDALPPRYTTVVVENTRYYYDNKVYYRSMPDGGYVVVQAPSVVQVPSQLAGDSTVNIPNSRGGYTSVILRRSGSGFIGPQGEYYPNYPSVEQLKVMYGN